VRATSTKLTIIIKKPDDPCTYTTLGDAFKTMRKTYVAFQLVQFAPNRTITHEVALLEDNSSIKKDDSRPDMILGRDLIKSLGLTLDFMADPPVINWEDASVPVVPRGYWTKRKISEAFPISKIEKAERGFENRSASMIAASYGSGEYKDLLRFLSTSLPVSSSRYYVS
jgi:hypothetical protein